MKSMKYVILIFGLLGVSGAFANYTCLALDGTQLTVKENALTRVGNTVVEVKTGESSKTYFGTVEEATDDSIDDLYSEKVIQFFDAGGSLTVTKVPRNCGRVICQDFKIRAALAIGEAKTYFSCDEIKP